MKRLISITTMIPSRNGFAWWPCELDVPDDLENNDDALIDHAMNVLVEDGMIRVTRLELETLEGRQRRVRKRRPAAIGRQMIGTVAPLHVEIVGE